MIAFLAFCSGASVKQNAAVQVSIKCCKHFIAECSVLWLKPLFPTPLKLVSVLVDEAIEYSLFWAPTSTRNEALL